jgi:hypothetical protein
MNPNNKTVQQIETSTFPSYGIGPFVCNNVHLRSRRVIHLENLPIIIEQLEDEPLPPEIEQHREINKDPTHVVTVDIMVIAEGIYLHV